MTNLGILEELNENIKKLISIFEVYPNPIDEKLSAVKKDSTPNEGIKKAEEPKTEIKAKTPEKTAEETVEPETAETEEVTSNYTLDDLAKKAQDVVRAGKVTELKSKLVELKLKKVTAAQPEQYDELMTYMDGIL